MEGFSLRRLIILWEHRGVCGHSILPVGKSKGPVEANFSQTSTFRIRGWFDVARPKAMTSALEPSATPVTPSHNEGGVGLGLVHRFIVKAKWAAGRKAQAREAQAFLEEHSGSSLQSKTKNAAFKRHSTTSTQIAAMYTDDSLRKRQILKHNDNVTESLRGWWEWMPRTPSGNISKQTYIAMNVLMAKVSLNSSEFKFLNC